MTHLFLRPHGNLGNHMLQLVSALALAQRVPDLSFSGFRVDFWNHQAGIVRKNRPPLPKIKVQDTPVDDLAACLQNAPIDQFVLRCMLLDCQVYPDVAEMQQVFPILKTADVTAGQGQILLNVRGAETLGARSTDYGPIPLSFYDQVLDQTGLSPIFMGQVGNDYYSDMLRTRFPKAEFISSGGPLVDFERMRQSQNIAISVSTFSWMAAWLSDAQQIHMPLVGAYNPAQKQDAWFTPHNDTRYHFYNFPVRRWHATPEQISDLEDMPAPDKMSADDLQALRVWADASRHPNRTAAIKDLRDQAHKLGKWKSVLDVAYRVPRDAVQDIDDLINKRA